MKNNKMCEIHLTATRAEDSHIIQGSLEFHGTFTEKAEILSAILAGLNLSASEAFNVCLLARAQLDEAKEGVTTITQEVPAE